MPMASKPEHHLNLNYLPQISATQPTSGPSTTNTSPIEQPSNTVRSPFGHTNGLNAMSGTSSSLRLGAGSPSHELGSRLYTKRSVMSTSEDIELTDTFLLHQSTRNSSTRRPHRSQPLGSTSKWRLNTSARNHTGITESRWIPRFHAAGRNDIPDSYQKGTCRYCTLKVFSRGCHSITQPSSVTNAENLETNSIDQSLPSNIDTIA